MDIPVIPRVCVGDRIYEALQTIGGLCGDLAWVVMNSLPDKPGIRIGTDADIRLKYSSLCGWEHLCNCRPHWVVVHTGRSLLDRLQPSQTGAWEEWKGNTAYGRWDTRPGVWREPFVVTTVEQDGISSREARLSDYACADRYVRASANEWRFHLAPDPHNPIFSIRLPVVPGALATVLRMRLHLVERLQTDPVSA
jgi:hypothetical protein